jgi:hypothetical protein
LRAVGSCVTERVRSEQGFVVVYEPENISDNDFSHELKAVLLDA